MRKIKNLILVAVSVVLAAVMTGCAQVSLRTLWDDAVKACVANDMAKMQSYFVEAETEENVVGFSKIKAAVDAAKLKIELRQLIAVDTETGTPASSLNNVIKVKEELVCYVTRFARSENNSVDINFVFMFSVLFSTADGQSTYLAMLPVQFELDEIEVDMGDYGKMNVYTAKLLFETLDGETKIVGLR